MKPGTIYFASREKKKGKSSEARYYLFCIEGKISISVLLFDENTECIDGWMNGWMNHYGKRKERCKFKNGFAQINRLFAFDEATIFVFPPVRTSGLSLFAKHAAGSEFIKSIISKK